MSISSYYLLSAEVTPSLGLNHKQLNDIGAYGEVRKALHKKTNMLRAIKIILKETTNEEEISRLINEVKILKGLVCS